MPVITVEMWKGRTPEQRRQLVEDLTNAFVKQGTPAEAVHVILNEHEKDHWAMGGKLCSERK